MKTKKRLLSILLSLALVLGLIPGMSLTAYAAETTVETPTVAVTGVTLNKTTLSMVGDMDSTNENLVATVAPDNASDKTVVWENSDATVVYGSPYSNLGDGGYNNLYSLRPRKAGTATITVRATNGTEDFSDDQTAVCTVKVYDPYPIGTIWHSGDPINLHGAWFISQQNDSTYLFHSKDMDVALPSFTRDLTDTTIATPDFLPVSEHILDSTVYTYDEGKTIPLYMIKPADKTSELPIGIKLVKGKGTSASPYEFELVYKSNPSFTAPIAVELTVNAKTVSAKTLNAAIAKAGVSADSVTTITLGKKVKKIKKGAFKNFRNANTLVVKSKKLTRARVKGSLKGSSITKVKVNVGKKKTNKKYVKRYKRIFTKKNCGKKVRVTR